MKYFLDTNVLLDALLQRDPFAPASTAIWAAIEERKIEGFVAAHAVTTIFYLVRKHRGNDAAWHAVSRLVSVFSIAAVDGLVIEKALAAAWPDFEDAVSAAAAERAGCDLIVTRDPRAFHGNRSSPYTRPKQQGQYYLNHNG